MCIRPIIMPNGVSVPCRMCVQCKDDQVNDWVGRCKAEMLTSQHNLFATLTYGGDDAYGGAENNIRAKMLHPEDMRLWLMLLRKWTNRDRDGKCYGTGKNKVRYLWVGEYGSEKGRAHFHCLVFCKGLMPPNIRLSEPGKAPVRYMHSHQRGGLIWPHGWSQWREADEGGARYVLNYLKKDLNNLQGEKRVGMSTQPPLGHDYFKIEAERYVEQGVSPRDHFYRFPNDVWRDGTPRRYYLAGSAWYYFMDHFAKSWVKRYGKESWPENEITDWYVEERYVRSQSGVYDWRDEAEWRQLIREEGLKRWRLGKRAREDALETKLNNGPPLVPIEAYEQS